MREKLQYFSIITNFAIIIMLIFICYKLVAQPVMYPSDLLYNDNVNSNTIGFEEMAIVPSTTEEKEVAENDDELFRVYITGEVNKPGVYEIDNTKRITDLIVVAGGPTDEANLDGINLAAFVQDAKHIKIPKIGEEIIEEAEEDEESSLEEGGSSSSGKASAPKAKAYTGPVNINTADLNMLTSLNGIGPVIAQNIIDYRNANGGFKSIEEIKKVSRIGESTYNQIKDRITIE